MGRHKVQAPAGYLTRRESAEVLGISLITFDKRSIECGLTFIKQGDAKLYKQSDILSISHFYVEKSK